jgi:hypothetical protein
MTARTADDIMEALLRLENKYTVLRAENKELRAENDKCIGLLAEAEHLSSENLKLRLMLSCVLPIAERHAAQGVESRTCAFIRETLELAPLPSKPALIVDNERSPS